MIMQLNNLCGIDIGCTNIKMAAIVDGIVYNWNILMQKFYLELLMVLV